LEGSGHCWHFQLKNLVLFKPQTLSEFFSAGEDSLCRLKEEVRRFAVDHTFKETAKKFGIHHSTVSGWVKAGEQLGINTTVTTVVNTQMALAASAMAGEGETEGAGSTGNSFLLGKTWNFPGTCLKGYIC